MWRYLATSAVNGQRGGGADVKPIRCGSLGFWAAPRRAAPLSSSSFLLLHRGTCAQVLELTPERDILWGGGGRDGSRAPPSDAPPCGFDNEHCQPRPMIVFALCAMVVALLVGAGLAWR